MDNDRCMFTAVGRAQFVSLNITSNVRTVRIVLNEGFVDKETATHNRAAVFFWGEGFVDHEVI